MPLGSYKSVESGTTCDRVKTKAECGEAAKQLGILLEARDYKSSNDPPYCFMKGGLLYFNTRTSSTSECKSGVWDRTCICKKGNSDHQA